MGDAKAVMRKMVEMFATGDLAALDSVVSTDYLELEERQLAGAVGMDIKMIREPGDRP